MIIRNVSEEYRHKKVHTRTSQNEEECYHLHVLFHMFDTCTWYIVTLFIDCPSYVFSYVSSHRCDADINTCYQILLKFVIAWRSLIFSTAPRTHRTCSRSVLKRVVLTSIVCCQLLLFEISTLQFGPCHVSLARRKNLLPSTPRACAIPKRFQLSK